MTGTKSSTAEKLETIAGAIGIAGTLLVKIAAKSNPWAGAYTTILTGQPAWVAAMADLLDKTDQGTAKWEDVAEVVLKTEALIAAYGVVVGATLAPQAAVLVAGLGILLTAWRHRDVVDDMLPSDALAEVYKALGINAPTGKDAISSSLRDKWNNNAQTVSPLIIDLDGDGVETVSSADGIYFDHDGDGFAESTGWVGKDDGLLVMDRNGDGKIDSGAELFGQFTPGGDGNAPNGFDALRALDSNHDGKFDAADVDFDKVLVWQDKNQDGNVQDGELMSLGAANVASISLDAIASNQVDGNQNQHGLLGSYTGTDGHIGAVTDVWFHVDPTDTIDLNTEEDNESTLAGMPDVEGSGRVSSLHQAILKDTGGTLLALVSQFAANAEAPARWDLVDAIIYKWMGAALVDPHSRGEYLDDARKLVALENYLGESFIQGAGTNAGTGNPGPNASAQINGMYQDLRNFVYGELILQTRYADYMDALDLTFSEVDSTPKFDVSDIVALLKARYASDPNGARADIIEFGQALGQNGFIGDEILKALRTSSDAQSGDGFGALLSQIGFVQGTAITGDDTANRITGDAIAETISGMGGNDILLGNGGDDKLSGGDGDDVLDGGAGNDTLTGGKGNDKYLFGPGAGYDTIDNTSSDAVGSDAVVIGGGLGKDDVTLTRSNDDLYISINGTSDLLLIKGYFLQDAGTSAAVGQIQFANGDVLGIADVKAQVILGRDVSDVIYGYATNDVLNGLGGNDRIEGRGGNDILDGGGGNDTLNGGAGSDTYLFGRNSGNDTISESADSTANTDIVKFDADILPTDIVLKRDGVTDDLLISIAGSSSTLRITNYFYSDGAYYGIEQLKFADGTVWDFNTVLNQTLASTAGSDTIVGSSGANVLNGGAGDDRLEGRGGNDVLDGGEGNDYLDGGIGSDNYLFGRNSGSDRIVESGDSGANTDVVLFDADVLPSDVILKRDGTTDDLLITIAGSTSTLRISKYFYSDGAYYGIEQLKFADGTVLDYQTVFGMTLAGTDGNDVLVGNGGANTLRGGAGNDTIDGRGGNDLIDGGAGNDTLNGNTGNDTYLFGRNSGNDRIAESGDGSANTDIVQFDADIAPGDVIVRRDGTTDTLLISIAGSDSTLRIDNYFYSDGYYYGIEQLKFADGTVWDFNVVLNQVNQGTASNDILIGSGAANTLAGGDGDDKLDGRAGNDVLDGGTGNDTLNGNTGSDVYLFGRNSGNDRIAESGDGGANTDVVRFDADIVPADIIVKRDGTTDDLLISIQGSTSTLRIEKFFYNDGYYYGIEQLKFADGTVWDFNAILNQVNQGTEGNDVLIGSGAANTLAGGDGDDLLDGRGGNDVLDGGSGNDTLNGGAGSDTYLFGRNSGNDRIAESSDGLANTDVVLFDTDIQPEDITVRRVAGTDDLILSIAGSNSTLRIDKYFYNNNGAYYGIEQLKFVDGTTWTLDTVLAKSIASTPGDDVIVAGSANDTLHGDTGNDTIYGAGGNDVLFGDAGDDTLYGDDGADIIDGGAGNDTLYGGAGIDVFRFGTGYGRDTIGSADSSGAQLDTVELTDINVADLSVRRVGDALVLVHANGQDALTINAYFTQSGTVSTVKNLKFPDGTIWDAAAIRANVVTYGDENDNVIVALPGMANTIRGLGGNDSLTGGNLNDRLDGGEGNDTLNGGAGDDTLIGGVGNDLLNGGSGSDTFVFSKGFGQDTITQSDSSSGRVDQLQFTDLASTDLLSITRSGFNVVLAFASGDSVTLKDFYNSDSYPEYKIDKLVFTDATWTRSGLMAALTNLSAGADTVTASNLVGANIAGLGGNDNLTGGNLNDRLDGGEGNDTLKGGSGNDILIGGIGDDTLDGGAGSDTFVFSKGFGQDTVVQSDSAVGRVDQLQFTDLNTSDVDSVSRSGSDLVLSFNSGDSVTLKDFYYSDSYPERKIDQVTFADGTIWTRADLMGAFTMLSSADDVFVSNSSLYGVNIGGGLGNDSLTGGIFSDKLDGGEGNDLLFGGGGGDFLTGGSGADTLTGGTGNDTYRFVRGSGADRVVENDSTAGNADALSFDQNTSYDQVWFSQSGSDLVVGQIGTSDSMTIVGWFSSSANHVEKFVMSDGKQLLDSQVNSLVSAMAQFAPPAPGQTTLSEEYQAALGATLAANWK
ncbi:calcium-binding protein [Cupriavidus sp. 2SB]|uniref:calcium-binding protein n=1 Tax=Cupriavidus sp. 2SB TaxID=2502199 RepID=UPI0010F8577F|nr:calcium-binding protein [Cupriavidus sp. 2SB]